MDASRAIHPTEPTLRLYAAGRADGECAAAVSAHLAECGECRQRVVALSADSLLARVRAVEMSSTGSAPAAPEGRRPEAPPSPAETQALGLADHPDYEIKKELGRGGMGVVYLAHNILMDRDEVLKVMGRHIAGRPGLVDRFVREIRAVARLRHPNIVAAYSALRLHDTIIFAMEYVDGLDLSRLVRAKGPLPVPHACLFVTQAALGLQHAHDEGLVHRDIKPSNLMLSRKGDRATVKVLDFGLAKAASEEEVDVALTAHDQALGTPDYIAPEQILDARTADIRADIYSLGGTLYYLLTGHPPFEAESIAEIHKAHILREPQPVTCIRPDVPAELGALLATMMAKAPSRRFQTPAEVARGLARFCNKGSAAGKFAEPRALATPRVVFARPAPNGSPAVSWPAPPVSSPPEASVATPERADAPMTESSAVADPNEGVTPAPVVSTHQRRLRAAAGFAIVCLLVVLSLAPYLRTHGTNRPVAAQTRDRTVVAPGPALPREAQRTPTANSSKTVGPDGLIWLFNGRDLAGWHGYSNGFTFSWPEALVAVDHGDLVFTNDGPGGFIATALGYHDYLLKLNYQFDPGTRGIDRSHSALFLGFAGWDGLHGGHSIHIGLGPEVAGNVSATAKSRLIKGVPHGGDVRVERRVAAEKPANEWNALAVCCEGRTVTIELNGTEVSRVECARPIAGPIGFIAPHRNIRYRNIRLEPIDRTDTTGGSMHDPRSVPGRWRQSWNGKRDGEYIHCADGTIRSVNDHNKIGDWMQSGSLVIQRWPNGNAPSNGGWVFRGTLSQDGQRISGGNQIRGRKYVLERIGD